MNIHIKKMAPLVLILLSLFPKGVQAQIAAFEYFIGNTDPGLGNGTVITTGFTPGDTVTFNLNVPIANNLPTGFHQLHIRSKNSNAWGHYSSRWFFCTDASLSNAAIAGAEYYFDEDPGLGNGFALNIGTGDTVATTVTIPIPNTLGNGVHFLHIRAKNNTNVWGHYSSRIFMVTNSNASNSSIAAMEYFFDQDPGLGNANPISVSVADTVNQLTSISTTGLGEGIHYLHIRAQNTAGIWGHYTSRPFMIVPTLHADKKIVAAEYFINEDPGLGNGTAIPMIIPADTQQSNHLIAMPTNLAEGEYWLHIRVKNLQGAWSHYDSRPFAIIKPKPGSGNAISFDGVNDYIEMPHQDGINFETSDDFTIETWVKIPVNQQFTISSDNVIIDKWAETSVGSGYPFSLRFQNANNPNYPNQLTFIRCNDASQCVILASSTTLNDDKWHHIALAKSGATMSLYIDGVLDGTLADVTSGSTANNAPVTIGRRKTTSHSDAFFTGSIDETRFWNTALNETQLRDRMCRKIKDNDPLFANLVGYYKFDENTGNNVYDGSANALIGMMHNTPLRITSGAAIGDTSLHDYVNTTKTVTLAHASGESLTIASSNGNPTAIHVYRVDEVPNTLSGTEGIGDNDKYFGVFQVGSSNPEYEAVYNYDGNSGVNATDENTLAVFSRTNNASTSWNNANATLSVTNQTLTLTGQSTEYILGSTGNPLPLELLSFKGFKTASGNQLKWELATSNTLQETVLERSTDGRIFFKISTLPYQSNKKHYSFLDNEIQSATNYYRLILKSYDDVIKQSSVIKLYNDGYTSVRVYPNPTENILNIAGIDNMSTILLIDIAGTIIHKNKVQKNEAVIDMQHLAAGFYILKLDNKHRSQTFGIIKR